MRLRPGWRPKQSLRSSLCGGARAVTRWACGGQQHRAALVGSLIEVGEWGSLRQPNDVNLWNQTMRVPGGWVVEVPGLPGPDQFARRVQLLNPCALHHRPRPVVLSTSPPT